MRSKAILVALLAFAFAAQAVPVDERQARLVARAWASAGSRFGVRLGSSVDSVRQFMLTNLTEEASFFTVKMSGGGSIIVSGDNEDSPVIAMSSADISVPEEGSPLRALVECDIRSRRRAARPAVDKRAAQRRWLRLVREGEMLESASVGKVPASNFAPTDMRVPVLVESRWNQSGHGENYYTPKNYVCGCVATAMAQVMRYHCFPVDAVPVFSNPNCAVNNIRTTREAIGGVYDWANMPLEPDSGMSETEKKAIGHLTYDCGVAVGMSWSASASGAMTADVGDALKERFGYANAEVSTLPGLSTDEDVREKVIYASLDAGYPVQLGINQKSGGAGHSVVADGYGYIDDVSYVHLNMGWSGKGDVWYHLPDITYVAESGGSEYEADIITACIYNIFPTQTGVVVSGRTMDDDGEVVVGAEVYVYRDGETEPVTNLVSSAYGVYAAILPAGEYTVFAATPEGFSGESSVTLGEENVWGSDVVLSAPSVRVISFDGVNTNICSTLDRALREAASFENPTVEVFAPTILKADVAIGYNCRIVADAELDGPATVSRRGSAAVTVDGEGVEVLFGNILFSSASDTPIKAVNGGIVELSGTVSRSETLSVEVDTPGGFALSGDIDGGVQVRVAGAMAEGDVFGFASDLATAEENASKIINPDDLSLGGEAFEDPDTGIIKLRWAKVDVHPSAAIASWLDVDEVWHHERSFDAALSEEATEVVLSKSSKMTKMFEPQRDVSFTSKNGAVLSCDANAQFVVGEGITASFSDFTIDGFSGSDALVVVDGGTVELDAGTVFANLATRNETEIVGATSGTVHMDYGPVVVKSGTLTMLPGAVIVGCRALKSSGTGGGGYGGGVYVYGGATFDMQGGTISGCFAEVAGGGVYAASSATVKLSGNATIFGNTANVGQGDDAVEDDLRRSHGAAVLVGGDEPLTGRIGIVDANESSNESGGEAFAVAADGTSADVMEASVAAFFCTDPIDEDSVRWAVLSDDGTSIKWHVEDAPEGPFPIDEDDLEYDDDGHVLNAEARVIREGGEIDYWETLSDALKSITEGSATIELLNDCVLDEESVEANWDTYWINEIEVKKIVVFGNVTLRTAENYGGAFDGVALVSRACECSIYVGADSSLTVEGVDFSGFDLETMEDGDCRLFDVRGGELVLSGANISDVYGKDDRASAAIVAQSGATVTLKDGSTISFCVNSFEDANVNAGAAGGIVAEGKGTTVYLQDCSIRNCRASKAGGVFIGNGAEVRISGEVYVENNECSDEDSLGNMVIAKSAKLVLEGELTGYVGLREGVGGDEYIFGTIEGEVSEESAANFVHDLKLARGTVDGDNLVWDFAGQIRVAKPETPDSEYLDALTYNGMEHVVLEEGEGYVVASGAATDAGTYHAVARLKPGYAWDDGTYGVVSFDWTIKPVALKLIARNASKIEGEEDPFYIMNYIVEGLVDGDDELDVIVALLDRDPGEEPGEYPIRLMVIDDQYVYALYSDNYTFDPVTSFTPGVFTIIASDGELLPPLDDGASLDDIKAALERSGVKDPNVMAVLAAAEADPVAALAAYNAFRDWAKNGVGDVAGVCASDKAWVSFEFGASELFESTPTVTFTSIAIEDPSIAAMRVTLVVKDGDAEKVVSPESVAALFEMSTDLKTWTNDLTAVANDDGSYTVTPKDSTLKMAVIRLKY